MKFTRLPYLGMFLLTILTSISIAQNQTITIASYNQSLPYWGTTWAPGPSATSMYYPSFYTGFVMRSEFPERVHLQLSRGNQTRVSVILDEQTVSDYLFDLVKRYEFYKRATTAGTSGKKLVTIPADSKSKTLPQLNAFNQIIESSAYGILAFVNQAKGGSTSAEAVYAKGLAVLSELNPGRVFKLRINLAAEFLKWKQQIQQTNPPLTDEKQVAFALNSLLWGRVNVTQKPTADVLKKLETAKALALSGDQNSFLAAALDLFKAVTGNKYNIKVLGSNGQFQPAIQCSSIQQCYLNYPEFTTIYPTGSVLATTKDKQGNIINTFATPGLWRFVSRGKDRAVDNIRDEPYYGWVPKMDYEAVGNGFHNPGVRFYGVSSDLKKLLGAPAEHNILWTVKRGGVSHGCSRLSTGHAWELRHIFPTEDEKMTQVFYFGNNPQDFDIYDIDGDGTPEVMGVEYFISYGLQGTSGLGYREGVDLQIDDSKRLEFYTKLYGAQGVFSVTSDGQYVFTDPSVSVHSYQDYQKHSLATRLTMNGQFKLYEQSYERDKVQLYSSFAATNSPTFKQAVRLLGRVRGCAPSSNKAQCGETVFDQEAEEVLKNVK